MSDSSDEDKDLPKIEVHDEEPDEQSLNKEGSVQSEVPKEKSHLSLASLKSRNVQRTSRESIKDEKRESIQSGKPGTVPHEEVDTALVASQIVALRKQQENEAKELRSHKTVLDDPLAKEKNLVRSDEVVIEIPPEVTNKEGKIGDRVVGPEETAADQTIIIIEEEEPQLPPPPPPPPPLPSRTVIIRESVAHKRPRDKPFIHESAGAEEPKKEWTCCDFRKFFPEQVALSSYPEILFFTMNVVLCVCATYIVVMGLTGLGWARILQVLRNRKSDEEFAISKEEDEDIWWLQFTAMMFFVNAFVIVLTSLIGMLGMYHTDRPLQIIYMLTMLICILAQVGGSMVLLNFEAQYCQEPEMRKNFEFHISTYYNNFDKENEPQFFLATNLIDGIQEALDCCGYDDYELYSNLNGVELEGDYIIPHSCCKSNWRQNIFCNYVLEERDQEYDAKIYAESGCGESILAVCHTISLYVGGLTGFLISFVMIAPYLVTLITCEYNRLAFKMLQIREVITVEKINLLTPLPHYPHNQFDDLPIRSLITDVDQIKLPSDLSSYIQDLQNLLGINSLFEKRTIQEFKKITESVAVPTYLLAPPHDETDRQAKINLVAGRHNFLLSRNMLKYASRVVTENEDINTYLRLRNFYLRNKIRTLRHLYQRRAREQTRTDATYPWRFHQGERASRMDKKKGLDWLTHRVRDIIQATVESAREKKFEGLTPQEIEKQMAEYDKKEEKTYPKIEKLKTPMPQIKTSKWIHDLTKRIQPTVRFDPNQKTKAHSTKASSMATEMESARTASTVVTVPKPYMKIPPKHKQQTREQIVDKKKVPEKQEIEPSTSVVAKSLQLETEKKDANISVPDSIKSRVQPGTSPAVERPKEPTASAVKVIAEVTAKKSGLARKVPKENQKSTVGKPSVKPSQQSPEPRSESMTSKKVKKSDEGKSTKAAVGKTQINQDEKSKKK